MCTNADVWLQIRYRLHPLALKDTLDYGRSTKSRIGRAKLDRHGEHHLYVCMPLIQEPRRKDGSLIGSRDGSQQMLVTVGALCIHLLYEQNTMIVIQLSDLDTGFQGRELGKLLRKSLTYSQSTL